MSVLLNSSRRACQFKYGEEVLVGDTEDGEWQKRIFIGYNVDLNLYACVLFIHEANFKNGDGFSIIQWKYCKPIPKTRTVELSEEMVDRIVNPENHRVPGIGDDFFFEDLRNEIMPQVK